MMLLNFPIRSRFVLKAIIYRKKQWIVLLLLEKAFSFSKKCFLLYCTCIWYLINFFILSRSVPIFHVFLSVIYLLFLLYHVLYTLFFLDICKGFLSVAVFLKYYKYLEELIVFLIKIKVG